MKRIAKDVGIGIVTTVILSIIQYASDWVINTANANKGQIGVSIANAVFYRASNRSYASMLHYAAGALSKIMVIIALIASFVHVMIVMNKTQGFKKEILKVQKKLSKEDKKVIRKMRGEGWLVAIVMTFVAVLTLLYTSTFIIQPFKLWERFELDLKVIAPYVEEGEIERLRSEWVLMKYQSDYDEIYEYIQEIQERQGIYSVEYSIAEIIEKGPDGIVPTSTAKP